MEQENYWISNHSKSQKDRGLLALDWKKTSLLHSNTIIWDRISISLLSKYWLLLPMELNFLESLNDSKILIKQWKPKRCQFWLWQMVMIYNKNFNNTGNKHKQSDLIDLLSSCFSQQFTFHIFVGYFKPFVIASIYVDFCGFNI